MNSDKPQGTIHGSSRIGYEYDATCHVCGTRNIYKTDSHGKWVCRKHAKPVTVPIVERQRKPGRNAKCPCGSGKKTKRCCGKRNQQLAGVG